MVLLSKQIAASALVALMAAGATAASGTATSQTTYGTVDPPPDGADPSPLRTPDTPAGAEPTPRRGDPDGSGRGTGSRSTEGSGRAVAGGHQDAPEPERTVLEASDVFQQMRQEPQMMTALTQARGVFIIPGYATAALLVGGAGGSGVMLEHRDGAWSPPVFYHIGTASLGLQAGVAVGPLVMLLMNDDAVQPFHEASNFSFDAAAGFTLVDWSALAEAAAGRGDVVIWSDMTGLVVDLSVAVSNINFDQQATSRYYRQRVTSPEEVLAGSVEDPREQPLQSEFAEFTQDGDGQSP